MPARAPLLAPCEPRLCNLAWGERALCKAGVALSEALLRVGLTAVLKSGLSMSWAEVCCAGTDVCSPDRHVPGISWRCERQRVSRSKLPRREQYKGCFTPSGSAAERALDSSTDPKPATADPAGRGCWLETAMDAWLREGKSCKHKHPAQASAIHERGIEYRLRRPCTRSSVLCSDTYCS